MALGKYEIAKLRSNEIDACIIKTLQSRQSFRVQAGAGSGKTYSLNKVIDWIQDNYWHSLNLKKQKSCLYYIYERPELPQICAIDDNDGFVKVITCNDFCGERQKGYI